MARYDPNASEIVVQTNYFLVKRPPAGDYYQYTVLIYFFALTISYQEERANPKPIIRKTALFVFLTLQTNEPGTFTPRAIYDGASIMYSRRNIPASSFPVKVGKTDFVVKISPDGANLISARDIQLVTGPGAGAQGGNFIPVRTLIQHLVRSAANFNPHWQPLKRNCVYSSNGEKALGGGLLAWKGFSQSVRPAVKGLYINIDVSTVAVYEPGNVIDIAISILRRSKEQRDLRNLSAPEFQRLERFLKGLQIRIRLGSRRDSTGRVSISGDQPKTISGLVPVGASHTFIDKDGLETTVQDYIERKYNCRLRFPYSFGVRVGRDAVFPAEFCDVTPGQLYRKRLNEEQQRTFIKFATQNPQERLRTIESSVTGQAQVFQYEQSDFMSGMSVQPQPEQVRAKLLPQMQLAFGSNRTRRITFGKWNVASEQYFSPQKVANFAVTVFMPGDQIMAQTQAFVKGLIQVMKSRGVLFHPDLENSQFSSITCSQLNPHNVKDDLMNFLKLLRKQDKPAFILVILPSSAPFKRDIKHWSACIAGIPTQCVRDRKFNTQDQYLNNVALKINAKIGGTNSVVPGLPSFLGNKLTMVIGCDVSHPGPGSSKPSIASLVGSLNPELTSYSSQISVQDARREIIQDMRSMFQSAFKAFDDAYKAATGAKFTPLDHLIVFRDGVSEGEYDQVQWEIDEIDAVFKSYYVDYLKSSHRPAVTFLIVTKRHHTRFFIPKSMAQSERFLKDNCPAGTVVDTDIVSADYPNFYLQSHGGLIGTSCPSHYIVKQNPLRIPLPALQTICYALCHNYASATTSVSIPAPVYYADKVCTSANWLLDGSVDLEPESEAGTATSDLSVWVKALKQSKNKMRLRELETKELHDVWCFICHLLVTRPSRSRALECFVIEIAQRSTHVAMLTLWFMQAFLKDLSNSPHDSPSFLVCQRVLLQCHEIIFGDILKGTVPYSSLEVPSVPGSLRRKVKPLVQPALVGLGMMLAGAPGLPGLTDVMGEVAIEQGRVDEEYESVRSLEQTDGVARPASIITSDSAIQFDQEFEEPQPEDELDESFARPDIIVQAAPKGRPMSRRQTIGAQTSPALPLHLQKIKPRLSEDPFGQNDNPKPPPAASPFVSTPLLPSSRHMSKLDSVHLRDIFKKYDFRTQAHLLRSHFCRTEVQFVLTLENICNKLLVVPKPARVSALRAELTALNHMLPAEVCMPMWCSSSDAARAENSIPEPHHRIVRIPPGESVVLNSAERAPYLLLIEIVHADLDFDPSKRNNREILKKLLLKEEEGRGKSGELSSFKSGEPPPLKRQESLPLISRRSSALGEDVATPNVALSQNPSEYVAPMDSALSNAPSGDEEEIDLVEQLYGADDHLRSRSIDLSETVVLPLPPKNRELDMAAWSLADAQRESQAMPHEHASKPSSSPEKQEDTAARVLSLDEYSERMRTAAVMLAQLNSNLSRDPVPLTASVSGSLDSASPLRWVPGASWLAGTSSTDPHQSGDQPPASAAMRMRLQPIEAQAIRNRIMDEMLALEEERMARMRENRGSEGMLRVGDVGGSLKTAEDEGIIRRELSKADPSAVVFSESWAAKKSRIRQSSPYGHLANWDCVSVIVKTGGDLRQEQLAVQLIHEFEKIWKEENCGCWVRYFRILITGNNSGLVETITDAVSIHSIKKAEYARRLAQGRLGHVSLYDHFRSSYGDPSSSKFQRAQRNFAKSLAGYSLITYLLQIKDRHNGNILLDREGHLVHIDFGFMLSNSPGNIGFEAAPFKLPAEYIEVMGGVDAEPFREFKKLFREGFDAARKHCDRIVTLVELMQKDSTLPCFAALGEQTANQLRERFQQGLTQSAVEEHVQRLIDTSLGSNWTRLYDSYQYYSQSIL
ncbi:Phosphatidylinositol 4-kinase pik1alpha (PI4-kinase)(PtdIns-4-kinase) [Steccherinum ochraceum]|uniref:1-phosphatidylinositol 4-kinase n=1 Tax=Steccherinum ochraceum TaxID=92696 RepID=A0A4R0S2N6_9APHY|nr:Phosphatidylinositol 4-kinase pik1alpha (PI4-kinase)(PtdIns-4-kinase) [Steccherinum ochraceum]